MRKVLLAGFEPYAKHRINPSWEVAKRLSGEENVEVVQLPVVYEKVSGSLLENLTRTQAEVCVLLSWGSRISGFTLEKVALNVADSDLPDNAGETKKAAEIQEGAPAAYFSNLPLEPIAEKLAAVRIPNQISYHADTFVPNYVFFSALHYMHVHDWLVQVGLIHIPWPPKFVAPSEPSMPWETMVRGMKTTLDFLKAY